MEHQDVFLAVARVRPKCGPSDHGHICYCIVGVIVGRDLACLPRDGQYYCILAEDNGVSMGVQLNSSVMNLR